MSRVSLLVVLVMLVFHGGLIWWIAVRLPDVNGPDEAVEKVIAGAIENRDGRLAVLQSPELLHLRSEAPSFWFVATQTGGPRLVFGKVPEELGSILDRIETLVSFSSVEYVDSPFTSKFARLTTEEGEVRVIYGGKTMPGTVFGNLMLFLSFIYLPTTLVPCFIVVITIPVLVEKAFRVVDRTAERAEKIDLNRPGLRLSTAESVKELDSLVGAINKALGRIEEDVQSRQRFIADAAHELRTPIAILQGRLDGLADGDGKSALIKDALRLEKVAEQLLDLQRYSMVLSPRDLDLVDVSRTVVADMAPLAISAGYDLEFRSDTSEFTVQADRGSIERAITNLVRNAVEHSGGRGTILVQVGKDGAVEVSDEGDGIAEKDFDRIFEPFYRAKPRSSGAGLGLSLVRQIASAHGGEVQVVRQEKGARFRFDVGTTGLPMNG